MTKLKRLTTSLIMLIALLTVGLGSSFGQVQAQIVTPAPLENGNYDAQAFKVADKLQCPVCQGQTVAFSGSGLAEQMRILIKKKLEQGESEAQILQYFVLRYGEGILTEPPKNGFTLLVWLLPIVGLLLGTGAVGFILRSWRKRLYSNPEAADNEDVPIVPFPIPAVPISEEVLSEYEARVERELANYANPLAKELK